ncbi:Cloroperoxidase [Cryphonectria parasitica EP155]|uniref:Cloroperoxidase n=1 Tax=Cryphonectria parasitica (strain ATCC 38755 / EP155) TaxID=660469 RepID=A0A9P5CN65_CRYP1|nr:Cloroperoxidase [Cryphonectria parasitica EP155]KAF3765124.1 Cloroperoxidase [Cryphonectria parasitica EP155]
MKNTLLLFSLGVGSVCSYAIESRQGSDDTWAPGGPDDDRGPCPMMNTLANHGFLPHNGRNLTEDAVVAGLKNGLNFAESLGQVMFQAAIGINPEPNATYFTLDMLNAHNVLEHDASMSRHDYYFGNNHVFNESIFDLTIQYWTEEILDSNQLAMGKLARQVQSKAFNPTYTFTSTTESFSLGEVSAPVIAFGDLATSTVNRTLVEYFFRNERLPTELGWTKKVDEVTLDNITAQTQAIADAATLLTSSNTTTTTRRSWVSPRDLHGGALFPYNK